MDLQILCSHTATSSSFLKTSQRDRWVFCTTVVAQVPSMGGQWPAVFLQLQELLLNLAIFSTCESQILGALWHKKFAWKESLARAHRGPDFFSMSSRRSYKILLYKWAWCIVFVSLLVLVFYSWCSLWLGESIGHLKAPKKVYLVWY